MTFGTDSVGAWTQALRELLAEKDPLMMPYAAWILRGRKDEGMPDDHYWWKFQQAVQKRSNEIYDRRK